VKGQLHTKSGGLKMKTNQKTKIYCLWGSCAFFDKKCKHNGYILTGEPVVVKSLSEAEKAYPNLQFCQDWKPEKKLKGWVKIEVDSVVDK